MNLVILTAALAILALLDNYSKNTMKELDYKNVIILRHKLILFKYYKKVIDNIFKVFCIVSMAFSLIILSSYTGKEEPNVPLKTIHMALIILVLPLLTYFYSAYINKSLIMSFHPIIRSKIEHTKKAKHLSDFFFICAVLVGGVQNILWILYAEKEYGNNEFNIGNYIMNLVLWFVPIGLILIIELAIWCSYTHRIKKGNYSGKLNLSSNIVIKFKTNKDTEAEIIGIGTETRIIDILKEDIIVDKNDILIYNRENFETIQKISLDKVVDLNATSNAVNIKKEDLANCYNT